MKRLFDFLIAGLSLAVLSPLIAVVAVVVRLRMGPPVLFRQVRPGWQGRPFTLLKFRTMSNARNDQGELLDDDQRLTPVGGVLRRTSLDELPQLWNVLRGDMSLVGPRPLLMEYVERYTPEQSRRHAVRPGITGWVQVKGRNALSWEDKFALDSWYVDHQSFALDLQILMLTFWQVIRGRGVAQDGHVTMPKFMGSKR